MIINEMVTTFRFALRHDTYWNMVKKIQDVKKKIAELGLMTKFWVIGGVSVALAAIGEFGLQTARTIDKLHDLGEKLGLSAQEMNEWAFAAQQAAIDLSSFEIGVKQFGRNMADAATGKAPKIKAFFDALNGGKGVALKEQTGELRHWKDVMLDVADAFQSMTGPERNRQLAFALKFMGRTGEEFVQLLNMGKARITAMLAQARAIGHIITPEEAERADAVIKKWDAIKFRARSLGMEVSSVMLPILEGLLETIEDLVGILVWFAKGISKIKTFISSFFKDIGLDAFRFGWMLKVVLAPVLWYTLKTIKALIVGFKLFGNAGLIAGLKTFGIYIALLLLLMLIGDEIAVASKDGKTLAKDFNEWLDSFDPDDNSLVMTIKSAGRALRDFIVWMASPLTTDSGLMWQALKAFVTSLVELVMDASYLIYRAFALPIEAIAVLLDALPGISGVHDAVSASLDQVRKGLDRAKGEVRGYITGYDQKGRPVVNQKNHVEVNVNVGPGVSPGAVGNAVAGAVTRVVPELTPLPGSRMAVF